jgi:hypothetical protein
MRDPAGVSRMTLMPTTLAAIVVALPFAALVGPLTWMAKAA